MELDIHGMVVDGHILLAVVCVVMALSLSSTVEPLVAARVFDIPTHLQRSRTVCEVRYSMRLIVAFRW